MVAAGNWLVEPICGFLTVIWRAEIWEFDSGEILKNTQEGQNVEQEENV